ncbi:MAG: hypothetical protein ACE5HJ_08690 [Thermoplasmata archaeon]
MALRDSRRELQHILDACRGVEERRTNPFLLDVSQALRVVSSHFPSWESVEDLYLDARVLNAISRVLQLQEARLRYEAGLFFADPDAVADKARRMATRSLAGIFLSAWHPVVELQQVTEGVMQRAMTYWEEIRPREVEEVEPAGEPIEYREEDLAAMGILSKEGFLKDLGDLWEELKASGPQDYWSFVRRGDFQEMVGRAYGVSFLVSYGYAEVVEEDGRWMLSPNQRRRGRREAVSLAVAISKEVGDG